MQESNCLVFSTVVSKTTLNLFVDVLNVHKYLAIKTILKFMSVNVQLYVWTLLCLFGCEHEYWTSTNCNRMKKKPFLKPDYSLLFLCLLLVHYISFSQANGICMVHSDVSRDIKLLYLPNTIQSMVRLFVYKLVYKNVILWPAVSHLNTPLSSASVAPV